MDCSFGAYRGKSWEIHPVVLMSCCCEENYYDILRLSFPCSRIAHFFLRKILPHRWWKIPKKEIPSGPGPLGERHPAPHLSRHLRERSNAQEAGRWLTGWETKTR